MIYFSPRITQSFSSYLWLFCLIRVDFLSIVVFLSWVIFPSLRGCITESAMLSVFGLEFGDSFMFGNWFSISFGMFSLWTFIKKEKMKDTEISKYVWAQKDKNRNFTIKWELYEKSRAYRAGNTYCKLCIDEKTAIIYADQKTILNS